LVESVLLKTRSHLSESDVLVNFTHASFKIRLGLREFPEDIGENSSIAVVLKFNFIV